MLDVLGTATRGRWTKRALDRRVRVLGANAPAPTASKQMERRIVALLLPRRAEQQCVALVAPQLARTMGSKRFYTLPTMTPGGVARASKFTVSK